MGNVEQVVALGHGELVFGALFVNERNVESTGWSAVTAEQWDTHCEFILFTGFWRVDMAVRDRG